ncbi:MAG: NUDIX domain-containing protein [Thermoplasmata archaeon]
MYSTRVKVYLEWNRKFVLSEGRYAVLKVLAETESISKTAEKLGMSYRYVWGVIRKIEDAVGEKIVVCERGGSKGGNTKLTEKGWELLKVFEHEYTAITNFAKYKHMRKPMLTADGVIIKNGKVLLIRRKNEPWKGMYALPGGFVEYGESVEEAVIREVFEETGLKSRIKEMVGIYSAPDRDPRGHIITVAYLLDVENLEDAVAGDDAQGIKLFPLNALPLLASDHEKIIQDACKIIDSSLFSSDMQCCRSE